MAKRGFRRALLSLKDVNSGVNPFRTTFWETRNSGRLGETTTTSKKKKRKKERKKEKKKETRSFQNRFLKLERFRECKSASRLTATNRTGRWSQNWSVITGYYRPDYRSVVRQNLAKRSTISFLFHRFLFHCLFARVPRFSSSLFPLLFPSFHEQNIVRSIPTYHIVRLRRVLRRLVALHDHPARSRASVLRLSSSSSALRSIFILIP